MKRLLWLPLLLVIACLLAGLYGALHNQISYTVSPEYFTQFKFHQFGIGISPLPTRMIVSLVGWGASWWMGLLIGVVLIPLGLVIPGNARYVFSMIRVFGIVVLTTLVVGLTALLLSFLFVNPETVGEFERYGNQITDDAAFARAGTMHNFSYLGGLVGLITGTIGIFRYRKKARAADAAALTGDPPPGA